MCLWEFKQGNPQINAAQSRRNKIRRGRYTGLGKNGPASRARLKAFVETGDYANEERKSGTHAAERLARYIRGEEYHERRK